jgi:hypothetical protein
MTVFKAGDNSYTYLGFINATAPVINDGATGVETNMSEDGIVYLTNLLWASDVDGSSWAWTNVTGSGPANGTVAVNGSGTNPVNWNVFTYAPNANFNGTNSFQVRVMDDTLLSDSLTVTVVVAAVNDAPTNTTPPTIIGGNGQYGTLWTAANGVWNDNLDTNAAYTHAVFTNNAGFAYQWQYSNDVNIAADATNTTFVPSAAMAGTNIRVRVTCTDSGEGTPGPQSATAYSAYVTVTAPTNDPPANTTLPGISGDSSYGAVWTATNGVWNDNSDTNVHYTFANFTNTAKFTYQWQYSNATPDNILNETNVAFTTTVPMLGTNIRVQVTCTDAGYGTPDSTSTVAYSAYKLVTAPSLLVFNKASDTWGNSANWTPSVLPSAGTPAVIGDTNVMSPAEALIGGSDTAAVKDLYLGTNTSSKGTLTMTGGTLTFPAAGNITVAGASSSTGTLNQTGGTVAGITNGTLAIAGGVNSVGSVTLGNDSSITSAVVIANASGANGTLTLTNSARWMSTTAPNIGSAANASGSLNVRGSAVADLAGQTLTLGSAANGTGMLTVADSGVVTNFSQVVGGAVGAGYGRMMVRNSGKVFNTGSGGVSIGGTNNNSILTVADDGEVRAGVGITYIGAAAGASGTLTLTNNGLYVCGTAGDMLWVGAGNNSIGWVNVNGGMMSLPGAGRDSRIGYGTGATGIVTITSGVYSNGNTLPYYPSHIGYGANSVGTINLQGGTLYEGGKMTLGSGAGAVGRVTVTGGTWEQRNDLEIGVTAGGTGLVTVANCTTATNITGAVTVGGGTTPGDRYGLVTISNATFGGSTAMTVWTNGFVELTGTGSVLRVNTLTVNGGQVTNHVQGLSGGVDVTNSALTSLVVTNGARMHLVFQRPSLVGAYWGLKWAGNRATQLQGMTNSGALSWDAAQAGGVVEIFTNATHTMVGYVVDQAGTTFRFR